MNVNHFFKSQSYITQKYKIWILSFFFHLCSVTLLSQNKNRKAAGNEIIKNKLIGKVVNFQLATFTSPLGQKIKCFTKICTRENFPFYGIAVNWHFVTPIKHSTIYISTM